MKRVDADAFMSGGVDWTTRTCDRCGAAFGNTCSQRHVVGSDDPDEVDLVCFDCGYLHDSIEIRRTGILVGGGQVSSIALMRRDLDTYQLFFDAEVALTPTVQALWVRYNTHPVLNDAHYKRAILIDTDSGAVHERTWGEKFAPDAMTPGTFAVEIFDSTCGYRGIEIYRWTRPGSGMWVQGKVRPDYNGVKPEAWVGSFYADRAYVDVLNVEVRAFLDKPCGDPYGDGGRKHHEVWACAEDAIRKQFVKALRLPEFEGTP